MKNEINAQATSTPMSILDEAIQNDIDRRLVFVAGHFHFQPELFSLPRRPAKIQPCASFGDLVGEQALPGVRRFFPIDAAAPHALIKNSRRQIS